MYIKSMVRWGFFHHKYSLTPSRSNQRPSTCGPCTSKMIWFKFCEETENHQIRLSLKRNWWTLAEDINLWSRHTDQTSDEGLGYSFQISRFLYCDSINDIAAKRQNEFSLPVKSSALQMLEQSANLTNSWFGECIGFQCNVLNWLATIAWLARVAKLPCVRLVCCGTCPTWVYCNI